MLMILSGCTGSSELFQKGEVSKVPFLRKVDVEENVNLLIMQVEIEGKSYRFLFDTGAPNVVDDELAEALDLKTVHRSRVTDSQGTSNKLDYVILPYVSIAGIPFENTAAIVAELDATPNLACMHLDGILGANLMRLVYWKIDPIGKKISFSSRRDSIPIPENAIQLPFRTNVGGTPKVDLEVGELKVSNATFDTGAAGLLSLFRNWVNLDSVPHSVSYGYHSAGLYCSTMDSLWYVEMPIVLDTGNISEEKHLVRLTETKKSLLGMEYLKRYIIYLDWESRRIYLEPNQKFVQRIPSGFGFTLVHEEDRLKIGAVLQGSRIDSLGVEVGDVIESINGMSGGEMALEQYCDLRLLLREFGGPLDMVIEGREISNIAREPFLTD